MTLDCVSKLKRLDTKGRLWSQEMILDVQGGYLVLSDIETKVSLDSLPLNNIIETNAILDTCAYNSLLTLTLQERNKRIPQVYMFQCEETGVSALNEITYSFIMRVTFFYKEEILLEIFNHVLNDLEIFMSDVTAAQNEAAQNPDKKKRKSKKSKKKGAHFLSIFSLQLVPQYPLDIPPTVQAPLLTDAAVQMLGSEVTPEEDELWGSLGDFWTWAEEDIPHYIPEFYDNWQPPPPSQMPHPVSRSNSQRFPPRQLNEPELMQAMYDFMARNNRELSLMQGDVVEVSQEQWWLVRNNRNEEGHVPQNVLMSMDQPHMGQGPVTLDMSSSSAEVSTWLAYKGFSKMTVRSLGVLNGRQLLGMTKDEIRSVCPEDGGKVFFQLQAIKSAIAVSNTRRD
uniref:SH3 domain-containing protein n=1 Tax=Periophthalmus magnuspinnatus TaxID=409849 RepID=A0A3B4A5Y3_9GOBI